MYLKKNLKTQKAQSVVEYILTTVVFAVGILVFFSVFVPATPDEPDNFFSNLKIKGAFNQAVDNLITQINKQ